MIPSKQNLTFLWVMVTEVIPVCAVVRAGSFYVAPSGTAAGPGTGARPYDLATAICGAVAQAGDTFWLRGGTYNVGHLATQIHGAIGKPITFRQMPGERAQVAGSLSIWGKGGNVIFRDFELCSGVRRRVSSQTGKGFSPTDLTSFVEAIQVYVPNVSLINLVVHDSVRSAFYTAPEATNSLIYGCIVYNTGWASRDNAEGHSFYLQGAGQVCDNIAFNSSGANFHVYANGSGVCLQNLTLEGNVAFNAGALQNARPYRDWIVGVDSPSVKADNIILRNNMGYLVSHSTALTQVQIGRERVNGSLVLSSNYWPQGLLLNNWTAAQVTGNLLAPPSSDYAVDLQQPLTKLAAAWNSNSYVTPSRGEAFHLNAKEYSFSEWKKVTGYDSASSWTTGSLKGTKVFIRPNRYEPGRAHIVVYNWDNLSNVAVNVCSVLTARAHFEVRNAQDFFSPPVLSGFFDGERLKIPMTNLSVAQPAGKLKTPAPTGPTFNVFVLLSDNTQKEITEAQAVAPTAP